MLLSSSGRADCAGVKNQKSGGRSESGRVTKEFQRRTATIPSMTHMCLGKGSGRGVNKSTKLRKPSSRGLFCFPAQGRETSNKSGKPSNHTSPKSLPSETQSFFLIPPPPITRQHAEGGNEHFSLSPLPTPAASRGCRCCTGVGEKGKRKIGGGEPLKTEDDFDEKIWSDFFYR